MDTRTLVSTLVGLAERVAPILPYGGVGLKIAQTLFEGMKEVSETAGLTREQIAALDGARVTLERSVNEHAKRVAAKLGDG